MNSLAPERSGGKPSTRSVMGRPVQRRVSPTAFYNHLPKQGLRVWVTRLGYHTGTLPQIEHPGLPRRMAPTKFKTCRVAAPDFLGKRVSR